MRDAIIRYRGVALDYKGEVGRLSVGDIIDNKGLKRFSYAPTTIPPFYILHYYRTIS